MAALRRRDDAGYLERLRREVEMYCLRFPVPGIDASEREDIRPTGAVAHQAVPRYGP